MIAAAPEDQMLQPVVDQDLRHRAVHQQLAVRSDHGDAVVMELLGMTPLIVTGS